KYGDRGRARYVPMDAAHAAENVLLQAVALDLGAVPVGAFEDEAVRRALGISADEVPLYLIPIGRTRVEGARRGG
ncbi:MAG TPA: nitroreductase family protein, partial [Candidatus Methylomirabilis sp.]